MRQITRVFLATVLLGALAAPAFCQDGPAKLLVVTVTKGFRHSSIPTAEKVLGQLAEKSGAFTVDYVRNDEDMAAKMTKEKLEAYDGFIFANTTGNLPLPDKDAFLAEIRDGKAFIGMHSASDTFHGGDMIDPYIDMCGGEFRTHGRQAAIECMVMDEEHPSTKHLGKSWVINQEEVYLFKNYSQDKVDDLLSLDKHPNDKTAGHYPVAWSKSYGEGRVFYTSLGHREDVWDTDTPEDFHRINPVHVAENYQRHILNGILWALGKAE